MFGRIVLVGEAAHPTTPHALRSTNMAIADAGGYRLEGDPATPYTQKKIPKPLQLLFGLHPSTIFTFLGGACLAAAWVA